MPEKRERAVILISCAGAIFWPGAFIFGFPGVMRQYWQQTFNVGGTEVGQTVFFCSDRRHLLHVPLRTMAGKIRPPKAGRLRSDPVRQQCNLARPGGKHDRCLWLGILSRHLIGLYLCPGADGSAALVSRQARTRLRIFQYVLRSGRGSHVSGIQRPFVKLELPGNQSDTGLGGADRRPGCCRLYSVSGSAAVDAGGRYGG